MSTNHKNKTTLYKTTIYFYSMFLSIGIVLAGVSIQVSAQDSQNVDLIIGQQQSGSNLDVSLCVKSTSGKITLGNVSNWLQYDKSSLVPGNLIEKGVYGNNTNGYSALKWQQVLGSYNKYTLGLTYNGDSQTPGQSGIQMQSNSPELFGKVNFDIIGSNKTIKLDKALYYSTENSTVPITISVKNVEGDCLKSTQPSSNPIVQTIEQSNPIPINQNTSTADNTVTAKLPTLDKTNTSKTQLQSDYESVRTGGLNNNSIYIVIFLISSLVCISINNSKIKYLKK